jgi:hypothetical protein
MHRIIHLPCMKVCDSAGKEFLRGIGRGAVKGPLAYRLRRIRMAPKHTHTNTHTPHTQRDNPRPSRTPQEEASCGQAGRLRNGQWLSAGSVYHRGCFPGPARVLLDPWHLVCFQNSGTAASSASSCRVRPSCTDQEEADYRSDYWRWLNQLAIQLVIFAQQDHSICVLHRSDLPLQ